MIYKNHIRDSNLIYFKLQFFRVYLFLCVFVIVKNINKYSIFVLSTVSIFSKSFYTKKVMITYLGRKFYIELIHNVM